MQCTVCITQYYQNQSEMKPQINMEVGELGTTNFKWVIDIDCFKCKVKGDILMSPIFSSKSSGCSRNDWQLNLYPKGHSEDDEGFLSLFLCNLSEEEVSATFSLSILNQDNVKVDKCKVVHNLLFKKPSLRKTHSGFRKFVKENFIMDPVNNVLKDNKLTITCKIIVQEKPVKRKLEAQCTESSCRFKQFYKLEKLLTNKEFSDVTVTAEGKSFYLHKCILATHSSVFEAMFRNDMREKSESLVEIADVEYKVLEEFFLFIYTGKVSDPKKINCDLLAVAEKYCVEGLKELCEESMSHTLSVNNAMEYLKASVVNNAKKLETAAIQFTYLHLEDFIENQEFCELGYHNSNVFLKIMKKLMVT